LTAAILVGTIRVARRGIGRMGERVMGKLYLALAAVLLLSSSAGAAIQHSKGTTTANRGARQVADGALPKDIPAGTQLFSNATLDPARCNYEYVELYGVMVVRTELKLTCTTHH
jgi:hypothetical protein